MPRYQDVSEDKQLPERPATVPDAAPARPQPVPQVPVTTTLPAPLRRRLTLALAVHDVKLKDAIAEAVETWLEAHPVNLE
ncbi:hypothetical protein [Streptomyces sp. H39-C1]|uniref:hypothetical protein n=1 Tax=Streptomyces sp. H39-C1 TaxID=3004355 RepID=UPI0022AFA7C7|nr:hypothetical protein [Streptomyces sp. H39-C1]MCZ4103702.1 hypothetical protein [Streptomyces sp. H39-C1]